MIGTDNVIIQSATNPKLYLNIESNGKLVMNLTKKPVPFSSFKNGFLAEGSFLESSASYASIKIVAGGIGEEWELVK